MYYVMSDIHGCYAQMISALNEWDCKSEHLVVMGDMIDRGPDSLSVIHHLMKLKENHDNVTILMGNHEEMLVSWLINTPYELIGSYYNPAHRETLMSFMGAERFAKASRRQCGEHMVYKFKKELSFMRSLPKYLETLGAIFVHAGVDLDAENWRTQEDEMLWIRNRFIYSKKKPAKRTFFGHTPTQLINHSMGNHKNNNIWISPDEMKVGIDGGVSMGGQLNVLRVNESGTIIEILKFI